MKGRKGRPTSSLSGSMDQGSATQRAMSRRLIDEHERDPFSYRQLPRKVYALSKYTESVRLPKGMTQNQTGSVGLA